jgi:hypothetical protein
MIRSILKVRKSHPHTTSPFLHQVWHSFIFNYTDIWEFFFSYRIIQIFYLLQQMIVLVLVKIIAKKVDRIQLQKQYIEI